jgi:hypothetical protein
MLTFELLTVAKDIDLIHTISDGYTIWLSDVDDLYV